MFRFCNYITQARDRLSDSGHVSRFFFLRYTFGELQSRVKFHFETVFLRDIFMHITYVIRGFALTFRFLLHPFSS